MEATDDVPSEVELEEAEVLMLEQLQKMAQVSHKSDELETIDLQLKHELDMLQTEQARLRDYRRELDLLNQERIAHVEELRLIHADINLLETTIKTAEEAERRLADEARRLIARGSSLKDGVDTLKYDLRIASDSNSPPPPVSIDALERHPHEANEQQAAAVADVINQAQRLAAIQAAAASIAGVPNPAAALALLPGANMAQQRQVPMDPVCNTSGASGQSQHGSSGSIFRQQPPPMKMCLSCHQQIHRNAPICPLCKAKSRSRNPKKPKRKTHDD